MLSANCPNFLLLELKNSFFEIFILVLRRAPTWIAPDCVGWNYKNLSSEDSKNLDDLYSTNLSGVGGSTASKGKRISESHMDSEIFSLKLFRAYRLNILDNY